MKFLHDPNLPETDVSMAVVSGTYPAFNDALHRLGVDTILVSYDPKNANQLTDHADLQIFDFGDGAVYLSSGLPKIKKKLEKLGFHVTELPYMVSGPYPHDVKLNAVLLRKWLIVNPKTAAPEFLNCFSQTKRIISVKQGYTKCSTAVVDNHSIITSDQGIAAAASKGGIDVLQIRPGYIRLKGYDYGFIGGACGKIGADRIAFCGRIEDHPDFPRIKTFLSAREIIPVTLADCPLTDVGGIVPLISR